MKTPPAVLVVGGLVETSSLGIIGVTAQEQADEMRVGSVWHLLMIRFGFRNMWSQNLLGHVVRQVSCCGIHGCCVGGAEVCDLCVADELAEAVVVVASI